MESLNHGIVWLETELKPFRDRLISHPLYSMVGGQSARRIFMESHVYSVWDFQFLLKRLQRDLTCVSIPWIPTEDPHARRLVNEIVLCEESDILSNGEPASHFEMYLSAMKECGASTSGILGVVRSVSDGKGIRQSFSGECTPPGAMQFVEQTYRLATEAPIFMVASAFAYGREEIIPSIFPKIVENHPQAGEHESRGFVDYLNRHIGVDSELHGPKSKELLQRLCKKESSKWRDAADAAISALKSRISLWDHIAEAIERRGGST